MFDLLIRNGKIVTPETVFEGDVAILGERIAGVLRTVEPVQARQAIDARGQSKHSFESGTIAAAFGGTTTIIDILLVLFSAIAWRISRTIKG
jgi:allantoinase